MKKLIILVLASLVSFLFFSCDLMYGVTPRDPTNEDWTYLRTVFPDSFISSVKTYNIDRQLKATDTHDAANIWYLQDSNIVMVYKLNLSSQLVHEFTHAYQSRVMGKVSATTIYSVPTPPWTYRLNAEQEASLMEIYSLIKIKQQDVTQTISQSQYQPAYEITLGVKDLKYFESYMTTFLKLTPKS